MHTYINIYMHIYVCVCATDICVLIPQKWSLNPRNIIGANSRYDQEYLKYFTGKKIQRMNIKLLYTRMLKHLGHM